LVIVRAVHQNFENALNDVRLPDKQLTVPAYFFLSITQQQPVSLAPAHQMHTRCTPVAHQMLTRCTPDAHQMHTRCTPDAHQMLTRCTPDAHQMHTRCTPNAHQMHTKCIRSCFCHPIAVTLNCPEPYIYKCIRCTYGTFSREITIHTGTQCKCAFLAHPTVTLSTASSKATSRQT